LRYSKDAIAITYVTSGYNMVKWYIAELSSKKRR